MQHVGKYVCSGARQRSQAETGTTACPAGLTQIKLFRNKLAERFGQDETHVKLNSGHDIPLLGWGSSGATGEIATAAVQTAVFAGFRVLLLNLPCIQHQLCLSLHPPRFSDVEMAT